MVCCHLIYTRSSALIPCVVEGLCLFCRVLSVFILFRISCRQLTGCSFLLWFPVFLVCLFSVRHFFKTPVLVCPSAWAFCAFLWSCFLSLWYAFYVFVVSDIPLTDALCVCSYLLI